MHFYAKQEQKQRNTGQTKEEDVSEQDKCDSGALGWVV